jgi:hypothetical protein
MTIKIELAPELQAELARRAATQGVGVDAYAAGLLEDAARLPIASAVADRSQSSPPPARFWMPSSVLRALDGPMGSRSAV